MLGTSEQIRPEDLPEMIVESARADASPPLTEYHAAIKEAKRQLILKAFEQAGGSYTEAARSLGVHPNYLHRLIRNLDLKPLLKK